MEEINAFDGDKSENMEEYKKTSMKDCMAVFESFLANLARDNNSQNTEESGEYCGV